MFRQLPSRLGSLRNLLPLAFASVAAISLTVIVGTVILQTRAILTDQTGQALLALAESDSQRLTEELAREVELLQNLAEDKAIYSHVVAMEETSPQALSPEEQATLLQIRHEAWISQTDEAFRNSVLLNAASNELNNFVSDFPEHIQLTLTDRHGGLVAAGGVPPDRYYYGGEDWWHEAWNGSRGAIYVGSSTLTHAGQDTTIEIAIPVQTSEAGALPLGVLHSQFVIRHLGVFASAPHLGETGELCLVDRSGLILYSSNPAQARAELSKAIRTHITGTPPDWSVVSDEAGQDLILGYAALNPPPERSYLDALDWTILVQQSRAEALATVGQLSRIAVAGGLLALALAIAVGLLSARRFTRPLEELANTTAAMASGQLERTAQISGPSELHALAQSFNSMSAQLRETLQGLEQRVIDLEVVEDALRQYTERLRALREVDQAILEARSSDEIARVALRHIRNLVPCQRTSVTLFDHEANEAVVLVADVKGETTVGTGERLPLDELDGIEDLRQGNLCIVDDYLTHPQPSPVMQKLHGKEGLCSFVSVPLVSGDLLIGALNLGATSPGAISADHVEIAREVADQLAIAIQDAQLLEMQRKRSAELESLRQASLHLTSSLELQPVLEAITQHALQLVSADNVHIFLYDGYRLSFGTAMWAGGLQGEPYAVPRPHGLTYAVARGGEQIVIPDVGVHPLFQERRWGGAVAGLPLRVGDQVCGVMNVAFEKPHVFTENEQNVLELLADQAATAIHNAHLHQQVRLHADELAQALARQEELERLQSEFIQNVSHELRSPLSLIRGYAELLDSGSLGDLQPEHQAPVAIIARRAEMLSDLVEDITLILEAGARPLDKGPVEPDEIARTAVEDFRVAAAQADLALEAKIADSLPPVSGSLTYLRRVLDNLLSNAIKFTPPGGTITVQVWQEDEQVALQVSDTGIGIPPDQLERVFERFYQVDGSARRRYGGVGLGLALVKEIVERHGGQITVESQIDEGTAFTVTLPIYRALDTSPESATDETATNGSDEV
jgi:signal transduction histidine kinase/HAMP domain-containing protein